MKEGDIVYFKSLHIEKNMNIYGESEYHFKPGDRYRIDEINSKWSPKSGYITNLEDSTNHFAHSSHWDKIITIDEWREIQLNKILK